MEILQKGVADMENHKNLGIHIDIFVYIQYIQLPSFLVNMCEIYHILPLF